MARQPYPYKANCISSWKSTNLTGLVEDPEEQIGKHGKKKKNAIQYSLAVNNVIFLQNLILLIFLTVVNQQSIPSRILNLYFCLK